MDPRRRSATERSPLRLLRFLIRGFAKSPEDNELQRLSHFDWSSRVPKNQKASWTFART